MNSNDETFVEQPGMMNFLARIPDILYKRGALRLKSGGALVALFLLIVLTLFVVELPTPLLDVLLVFNVLIALTLLLRGLFGDGSSRLYSFPTILVLTTLFRLSLNVSSTKLILLNGDQGLDAAGRIIQSFGSFVVGGDFIVGAIVFAIIAIVNFVVIAKGSTRVAEVAARFNLDALPGRQLAIDSELRSGTITPEEAAVRRDEMHKESQFFGSMDGAMKWVQGDAIAGLAITFINAIGGIGLGLHRGLAFGDAVDTFGVLTIGDGLISILPSLLISVSAGIIVTNVGSEEESGSGDLLFSQIFQDTQAPLLASYSLLSIGVLSLVGIINFPPLPFFFVGGGMLIFVINKEWFLPDEVEDRLAATQVGSITGGLEPTTALPAVLQQMDALPEPGGMHSLRLEVDQHLLGPYVGANRGTGNEEQQKRNREQFDRIAAAHRDSVFKDYGIVLPPLNLSVSGELSPGQYRVVVREQILRRGQIRNGAIFAATTASVLEMLSVSMLEEVRHPINQGAAAWIDSRSPGIDSLRHLGVELLNPAQFMVTESVGGAFDVIDELFGLGETRALLAHAEGRHEHLVKEVIHGEMLSTTEFAEILRRLVRERVSIRDLKLILEGIAEFCALSTQIEDRQEWMAELHGFLRVVLSRGIVNQALGSAEVLRAFMLSSDVEDEFRSAVSLWDHSRNKPPLDPKFESELSQISTKMFSPVVERGAVPIVVLCPSDIRSAVQDFFSRNIGSPDWIRALAYNELRSQVSSESIGTLSLSS